MTEPSKSRAAERNVPSVTRRSSRAPKDALAAINLCGVALNDDIERRGETSWKHRARVGWEFLRRIATDCSYRNAKPTGERRCQKSERDER